MINSATQFGDDAVLQAQAQTDALISTVTEQITPIQLSEEPVLKP